MDDDKKVVAPQAGADEDRIEESLQITEQLLVILGEAWHRIDELEAEIGSLKKKSPATSKVRLTPKVPPADGIVIVDDSKIMQVRLRSSINSLGFNVIGTAGNGQRGAELVVKLNPKLVILDHQMPVMGGVACLRAIRLQNTDVRVILCTGGITEQISQDYLKLDISAIITKPIQLDRFVKAVRECMSYDPAKAGHDLEDMVDSH